MKRFLVEEFPL